MFLVTHTISHKWAKVQRKIKELFYGDKYGVMSEVVKQVFARQDEFVADPHTFRELEIVRQTLIAVEKMKKNGDCIAEGELGDAVTVFL